AGADKTVTTLEDVAYTFAATDFGFSDPNDIPANHFAALKITALPLAGTLAENGIAVMSWQFVGSADITAGKLKFTPAANASHDGYASFMFQVQDDRGTANRFFELDAAPNALPSYPTRRSSDLAGADKTVTTLEDVAYTFAATDFGFSDPNDIPASHFAA